MRLAIALAAAITLVACSSEDATMEATYVDAGGTETALEASVATDAHSTEDAAPESSQDAAETSTADTSTKPPVCAPGKQEYCACVGGKPGAQICKNDGSGWDPCECPEAPDAGVDANVVVDSGALDAGSDAETTFTCGTHTCQRVIHCVISEATIDYPGCCSALSECGGYQPALGCNNISFFELNHIKCH